MTLLGTFDAVVFDFDGTVGDSHAAMVRAYLTWAHQYGIDPHTLRNYTGLPSRTIAEALLPADLVDEAAARIEELEVEDVDGVIALPGAAEAFAAVPDERRAIATSCTAPLLNARLAETGLPRPTVVVTVDQVANGKPAPDSFLLAAERLGFEPARCLVVEDAPGGVKAARAAGMPVLGVLTNHTAEELGADWHAENLAAVRFETTAEGVRVAFA